MLQTQHFSALLLPHPGPDTVAESPKRSQNSPTSHGQMDTSGVQLIKYLQALIFTLLQTPHGKALTNLVKYETKVSSETQQAKTQNNQGGCH